MEDKHILLIGAGVNLITFGIYFNLLLLIVIGFLLLQWGVISLSYNLALESAKDKRTDAERHEDAYVKGMEMVRYELHENMKNDILTDHIRIIKNQKEICTECIGKIVNKLLNNQ